MAKRGEKGHDGQDRWEIWRPLRRGGGGGTETALPNSDRGGMEEGEAGRATLAGKDSLIPEEGWEYGQDPEKR